MQNNENPYDEFLKNIAKLVEDIVRNMPDGEGPRFIGCTIIAGGDGIPPVFSPGDIRKGIQYEVIDAEDRVFITAQVPSDLKNAPYADIKPEFVKIFMDDLEEEIPLPEKGDVIHSFYMVRHGVLDIVVKKARTRPASG
jgi:hypothetical protein